MIRKKDLFSREGVRTYTTVIHFLEIFKTQVNKPIGSYQIQHLKIPLVFDISVDSMETNVNVTTRFDR